MVRNSEKSFISRHIKYLQRMPKIATLPILKRFSDQLYFHYRFCCCCCCIDLLTVLSHKWHPTMYYYYFYRSNITFIILSPSSIMEHTVAFHPWCIVVQKSQMRMKENCGKFMTKEQMRDKSQWITKRRCQAQKNVIQRTKKEKKSFW